MVRKLHVFSLVKYHFRVHWRLCSDFIVSLKSIGKNVSVRVGDTAKEYYSACRVPVIQLQAVT